MSREEASLRIGDDFVARRFGETTVEEVLDHAIRTAMALLTEGVVAAPTEGIGKVFKGVVDSQGNRPTSEGYFQAPPENKLAPGEGKPGAVVEIHKRK